MDPGSIGGYLIGHVDNCHYAVPATNILILRETSGVQSTTHVKLQTQPSIYNGYEPPSPPQR